MGETIFLLCFCAAAIAMYGMTGYIRRCRDVSQNRDYPAAGIPCDQTSADLDWKTEKAVHGQRVIYRKQILFPDLFLCLCCLSEIAGLSGCNVFILALFCKRIYES